jgi:hypothetical protein
LEAIDELAARQDRSRSSFVRRELQRIVAEYQAKEALSNSRLKSRGLFFRGGDVPSAIFVFGEVIVNVAARCKPAGRTNGKFVFRNL